MALSASVRAITIVGVPQTSAASRAAMRLRSCAAVADQDLTAKMTTLLLRGELVLEMDAGSACFNECLHDLEGVERSAKTSLGIGHDRRKPVALGAAFGMLDLVGAGQRFVDAATKFRAGVCGVQTSVRIDLARSIGVCGNLPAGEIDHLEPGTNHLHCLVASHCAETGNVSFGMQQLPQAIRPALGESVLDLK